jgi:site-specific recombinase XerD
MSKITFSQAMQGYLLAIGARHLSEHTVKDYVNTFNKFTAFLSDDVPIEDISHKEIEAFFTAQTTVSNKLDFIQTKHEKRREENENRGKWVELAKKVSEKSI